jgi:hypothetical protein
MVTGYVDSAAVSERRLICRSHKGKRKKKNWKKWSLRDTALKYADLPVIVGRKFWLSRLTTASSELYSPETETNAISTARSHYQKDKVMPLQYRSEYSVSLKVGSRYFGSFKGIVWEYRLRVRIQQLTLMWNPELVPIFQLFANPAPTLAFFDDSIEFFIHTHGFFGPLLWKAILPPNMSLKYCLIPALKKSLKQFSMRWDPKPQRFLQKKSWIVDQTGIHISVFSNVIVTWECHNLIW